MDPLLIASGIKFGYDLFQRGKEREFAKKQASDIGVQINLLNQQKKEIEKLYDQKKRYTKAQFQEKLNLLSNKYRFDISRFGQQFDQSVGDISEASSIIGDESYKKSGLAFLGNVERERERVYEKGIRNISQEKQQKEQLAGMEYQGQYTDIESILGEKLFNILESKTIKTGEIDVMTKRLEGEKRLLEKQSEDKFLGIF